MATVSRVASSGEKSSGTLWTIAPGARYRYWLYEPHKCGMSRDLALAAFDRVSIR
jgi:hypothetical protein